MIHRTGRVIGRFFTGYDILLTPTMCTPPHKLGQVSMMSIDIERFLHMWGGDNAFTQLFNASGNPAMSVPLHWLAGQLETAQPWANRRPAQRGDGHPVQRGCVGGYQRGVITGTRTLDSLAGIVI